MGHRFLGRVAAVIASLVLTLAVVTPVFAFPAQNPGNWPCPTRPSGMHVVWATQADGYAPGQSFYFYLNNGGTKTATNEPGVIGGGQYFLEGNVYWGESYLYCG